MRTNDRDFDVIRPITIIPDYMEFADGSALIEMGKTKVLATATIDEKIPPFLRGSGQGWITAEYSMLPRSTEKRTNRERTPGRISGRTQEIQRLIGRSLRAAADLRILEERTVIIDCDVIQADGGTRSASITAGCVALALSLKKMMDNGVIDQMPLKHLVSAVSVGIVEGEMLLDLDYIEDSNAETDMNVVETDSGQIVEIQATAEKTPFTKKELHALLDLADKGIQTLITAQREILKQKSPLFMAYN
ncbi:MAG: ribonuclease PH [Candidatus Aminicenantaceae bacterium]